jgi:hypothetical protein
MAPVATAFAELWPEAEVVNLLEDALSPDRARDADLSPQLHDRITTLARYAAAIGAAGVLFTCSAFGRAIEAAAAEHPIPILKPNEAMFEAALQRGQTIAMIATFKPSVAGMSQEFAEAAASVNPGAELHTVLVDHALDALKAGDSATHDRLVADAVAQLPPADAIVLAHFSTARAAAAVRARTDRPVLTSPDAAVVKLRGLVEGRGSA